MIANTGFVGDVVADEERTAALERLMRHQLAHAGRLGETGMLDLADAFARQHLDRRIRQIGPDQRHRLIDRLLRMRREAIMQRQRIALVFEQNARAELARSPRAGASIPCPSAARGAATASLSASMPHFRAMAADGGKLLRRKDQIDIVERTAADQRQRAVGPRQQAIERLRPVPAAPRLRAASARDRAACRRCRAGCAVSLKMRHQRARHRNGFRRTLFVSDIVFQWHFGQILIHHHPTPQRQAAVRQIPAICARPRWRSATRPPPPRSSRPTPNR